MGRRFMSKTCSYQAADASTSRAVMEMWWMPVIVASAMVTSDAAARVGGDDVATSCGGGDDHLGDVAHPSCRVEFDPLALGAVAVGEDGLDAGGELVPFGGVVAVGSDEFEESAHCCVGWDLVAFDGVDQGSVEAVATGAPGRAAQHFV